MDFIHAKILVLKRGSNKPSLLCGAFIFMGAPKTQLYSVFDVEPVCFTVLMSAEGAVVSDGHRQRKPDVALNVSKRTEI